MKLCFIWGGGGVKSLYLYVWGGGGQECLNISRGEGFGLIGCLFSGKGVLVGVGVIRTMVQINCVREFPKSYYSQLIICTIVKLIPYGVFNIA